MKKINKLKKFIFLVLVLTLSASSVLAQKMDDTRTNLREKATKEILKLPYYGVFDAIKLKIEGDTVTLLGQVMNPTTKEDAENAIKKLDGVKTVKNEIKVLPLSRFDDNIRYKVWQSIANKGSLYRYLLGTNPSMRIIVKDGRVSLQGFVNTKGDYDLAYIAAREVPGTFAVENDLEISKDEKLP